MPNFKAKKEKPKIEEVTKEFGEAHAEQAAAKTRMEKLKKQFFDLIQIPASQLARQTIYYEGSDPDNHVATLYPKWKIIKKEVTHLDGEWRIIIEEDPKKKSFSYINPIDGMKYTRTVAESAPGVDLDRLKRENPSLFNEVTVEPPKPERVLKPLSDLEEDQKDELKEYLLPVNLTNRMEKPSKPKAEELEELPHKCTEFQYDSRRDVCCVECGQLK